MEEGGGAGRGGGELRTPTDQDTAVKPPALHKTPTVFRRYRLGGVFTQLSNSDPTRLVQPATRSIVSVILANSLRGRHTEEARIEAEVYLPRPVFTCKLARSCCENCVRRVLLFVRACSGSEVLCQDLPIPSFILQSSETRRE